jgi:hypothetical protein
MRLRLKRRHSSVSRRRVQPQTGHGEPSRQAGAAAGVSGHCSGYIAIRDDRPPYLVTTMDDAVGDIDLPLLRARSAGRDGARRRPGSKFEWSTCCERGRALDAVCARPLGLLSTAAISRNSPKQTRLCHTGHCATLVVVAKAHSANCPNDPRLRRRVTPSDATVSHVCALGWPQTRSSGARCIFQPGVRGENALTRS